VNDLRTLVNIEGNRDIFVIECSVLIKLSAPHFLEVENVRENLTTPSRQSKCAVPDPATSIHSSPVVVEEARRVRRLGEVFVLERAD
jgi:hypothetical protein